MLEVSQFTIRLPEVTQGGPTRGDCFKQDVTNDGDHFGNPLRTDVAGLSRRMDASAKQHLAHVDIAEPGHDTLIEKRGFDWASPALQTPDQVLLMKVIAQRFGTQCAD